MYCSMSEQFTFEELARESGQDIQHITVPPMDEDIRKCLEELRKFKEASRNVEYMMR